MWWAHTCHPPTEWASRPLALRHDPSGLCPRHGDLRGPRGPVFVFCGAVPGTRGDFLGDQSPAALSHHDAGRICPGEAGGSSRCGSPRSPHPAGGSGRGSLLPAPLDRTERFFLGPFQGVLQSLSALIQLAGISSAARCAAQSGSWRAMGLPVAKGILCWDSGSHRGWTDPFWALLLSRRAARVQMWVWVGAKPCPGCSVPITSVPKLSPALCPLVHLAPQNPWLGVS